MSICSVYLCGFVQGLFLWFCFVGFVFTYLFGFVWGFFGLLFFVCFFLHHWNEVCLTPGPLDKLLLVVVQCLLASFFLRTGGDVMQNK